MKPVLIFDGDCAFCRRWITRWKYWTEGAVEYGPYQTLAPLFPQIQEKEFQTAVQLIDADGKTYRGAEAVFRTLHYAPGKRWLLTAYNRLPGFKPVSEILYWIVARNRRFFSMITRWLWGGLAEPSQYRFSRWLFLRFLGAIYLIAFVSLWMQLDGLLSSRGILPVSDYLRAVSEHVSGFDRFRLVPTLCWWKSSDRFLHLLCGGGAGISILLMLGLLPVPALIGLWVFYLSLVGVGQEFLSFQWDNLLLETGFLAIFFAPNRFLPNIERERTPSTAVHWALRFLLFKLMFSSGCVKLLSGDAAWRSLTALQYHYETQPLPTWIGWWAHQLPPAFQRASVEGMFALELGLPFLMLLPRRPRLLAACGTVFFMALIFLTGNYCFFNLLTVDLCVLLIDDAYWVRGARWISAHWSQWMESLAPPVRARPWRRIFLAAISLMVAAVSAFQVAAMLARGAWVGRIESQLAWMMPFRTINHYGLFAVMTTSRREIIVEGSSDGTTWLPYEFKWKPGDILRRPGFVEPHQPRLDWQMWFAALGSYQQNPWFIRFLARLLEGSPEVLALLKTNPFPESPPRYIRGAMYDYHFTDIPTMRETGALGNVIRGQLSPKDASRGAASTGQRTGSDLLPGVVGGAWWRRTQKGWYCPVVSLQRE